MSNKLSTTIVKWQKKSGRSTLPWQYNPTAYRVWISEIMLQQTQVTTVIPYYQNFLQRFPTIDAVANANEDDVLAAWSGLGYYARARNLQKSARIIQHNGIPQTLEQWQTLPGIGESTAAAIMVFAYGQRHAILDGNVKRLFARLFAIDEPIKSNSATLLLWQKAKESLPDKKDIRPYTQGLMDLGAMVCLQTQPLCSQCPVGNYCIALKNKQVNAYPVASPKKTKKLKNIVMLCLKHEQRVLLYKRPAKGIWASLWLLPEAATKRQLISNWQKIINDANDLENDCAKLFHRPQKIKHELTHFSLTITVYTIALTNAPSIDGHHWLSPKQWQCVGICAPINKLLKSHFQNSI